MKKKRTYKSISTKELRENFPHVRDQLAQGVGYTLIHRSKPIARITPVSYDEQEEIDFDELFSGLDIEKVTGKKLTPEYINEIADTKFDD